MHFTCIHPLFLPSFSTPLTLPFIKTLYSRLFHITRICSSKYIIKNSRNKIRIHLRIFRYYKKITQWYNHRIHFKILCFSILLKTWIKITIESHVLLKKFKTTIKIYGISKQKLWFSTTNTYSSSYSSQNCVSKNPLLFPKSSCFGQSLVTSPWFKTNNNSKFKTNKVPLINPYPKCLFIQNHVIIQPP